MLVLSRKKGESIMIGDEIELTVLGVEGDVVKLGINAPKFIEVYRKEIYESIQHSNKEASELNINLSQLNDIFREKN